MGRNLSRHGYYIIRIASRNNIPFLKQPSDLKNIKTKEIFDWLFGL